MLCYAYMLWYYIYRKEQNNYTVHKSTMDHWMMNKSIGVQLVFVHEKQNNYIYIVCYSNTQLQCQLHIHGFITNQDVFIL